MKKLLLCTALATTLLAATPASAEKYKIDVEGAHAFIQFKIKHLGYSWLHGRFNKFDGEFNINREDLEKSTITLKIDPASIDSNHAERDKHLKGKKFLEVWDFTEATFASTSLKLNDDKKSGTLTGDLNLHGITKSIDIDVKLLGEGKDPWGGYRIGFEGTTKLGLKDFGIDYNLGPASTHVEMFLSIEGIRE